MKNLTRILRTCTISSILLMLFSVMVHAGSAPLAPLNFKTAITQQYYEGGVVTLSWDKNTEGTPAQFYNIYVAYKNTDDLKEFKLIQQVYHHDKTSYQVETKFPNGNYSFYITAAVKDDQNGYLESPATAISKVSIDNSNIKYISLVSQLPSNGAFYLKVGETLSYKAEVKTNIDGAIKFKLDGKVPDDFKINETTGEIVWTAKANGSFAVYVIAYSDAYPTLRGTQVFKVVVGNGDDHNNKDYIKITSFPNPNGSDYIQLKIGDEFNYKVTYETNLKDGINFRLDGKLPDDFKIDTKTGEIKWTAKANGTFAVYIIAYSVVNPKIQVGQVFKIAVGDGIDHPKNYVKIVSHPSDKGDYVELKIGDTWNYQVKYETNLNEEINFKLDGKYPETMSIDAKTGLLTFTPKENMGFAIAIIAYSVQHPDIAGVQYIKVLVGTNSNPGDDVKRCAVITGQVVFADGTVATEGFVNAWYPKSNTKEGQYNAPIGKDGKYELKVPAGVFALEAWGKTFKHEWFDDATDYATATKVEIKCEDTYVANFAVEPIPVPKYYKVTGTVLDAETNAPIYAYVNFMITDVVDGQVYDKDMAKRAYMTKTNDKGEYSIELPDNLKFVAYANSYMNSIQYMGEYYDNVTNVLEATQIHLTGDKVVNFTLSRMPELKYGSLSGVVKDSAGTAVKSKLIAVCLNKSLNNTKYQATTETDDNGNFKFEQLVYGDYIILSMPADRKYVPGYYKLDDFAVINWSKATVVKIESSVNGPISIKHSFRHDKGITNIKGYLGEGKGKKFVLDNTKDAPLAGAMLFVIDENGKVIDFTYSNTDGNFSLNEVISGHNTLVADKVGYETLSTPITTDLYTKNSADVSLSLNPVETTDVEDNTLSNITLYPVPVLNSNVLNVNGLTLNSTYKIVDLLGNVFANGITSSENAQLDISNLSSGTYYLIINTIGNVKTLPFNVIK